MSVHFGKCNFDGRPVDPEDLEKARPVLAPYGPDGEGYFCENNLGILYRAFHTTPESPTERQPHISQSGLVITWDGRLDNREDLLRQFAHELSAASNDLEIAAAAYGRWGTDALGKLIGDWAVSVWNPKDESLILATDFVGSRHLYYSIDRNQVTWSTILDTLVLLAGHSFKLDEEYVSGWLAFFPAAHLTPYVGIHAVPPSSFVRLKKGTSQVVKYWDFDSAKKIRHSTDQGYEEHFRVVFAESIRRRLRSIAPVLAELSGGMDSSSIVCVADAVASASDPTSRLETISYYDDHEPNWNERPFFTRVEQQRGRAGLHIDIGSQPMFCLQADEQGFTATPAGELLSPAAARQLATHLSSKGFLVLLSGIGGDETLGGVPTPVPELADLLARGKLAGLAHQLKVWALSQRKPWLCLLREAVQEFVPSGLAGLPQHRLPAPWIDPDLVERNRPAFRGYERRLRIFGPLPSFQENLRTLDGLRRQLACSPLRQGPPCEIRYPYLDRCLLEFLYSIPREQLVRPGQRRSLMRRAMAGVVPAELLARKRKAYVSRAPLAAISGQWRSVQALTQRLISASFRLVDAQTFALNLERARQGQEVSIAPVLRLLMLEWWLKAACARRILSDVDVAPSTLASEPASNLISAEKC